MSYDEEQRLAHASGHAVTCPVPCCGDPWDEDVIPDEAVEAAADAIQGREIGSGFYALNVGSSEATTMARLALEAALPHLRARQVDISTKVGYALGRAEALEEVADEMALSSDWQLDDPRVGYVDVQIDKDTYRRLVAARKTGEAKP